MPARIPAQKAENRQGFSLYLRHRNRAYSSIGKKSSFMCSHTDSFTGVNSPMTDCLLDQSYRKWDKLPAARTNRIPMMMPRFIHFMNTPPFTSPAGYVCGYPYKTEKNIMQDCTFRIVYVAAGKICSYWETLPGAFTHLWRDKTGIAVRQNGQETPWHCTSRDFAVE